MKKIICLSVLFLILIISVYNKGRTTSLTSELEKYTPRKLVETYYNCLASGNIEIAKQCLSDQYFNIKDKSFKSDLQNIKEITDIKVSKEEKIKLYGNNYDEVQVVADYYIDYISNEHWTDGKEIRFIYVEKKDKDSPWKILSFGTGP